MGRVIKGQLSTPDDPCGSKLMTWIRDVALPYRGEACLIWPFGRSRDGYGNLGRGGKNIKAHRYVCTLVKGEPPTPEHHAAHSCNNGHLACVNPMHLRWKTSSENHKESRQHPRTVLTPEQVIEIKRTAGTIKPHVMAAQLGVREGTIRKIRNGLNWRSIPSTMGTKS